MFSDVTMTSKNVKFATFWGSDLIIWINKNKSETDNSFHFLVTLWSVIVAKNKMCTFL